MKTIHAVLLITLLTLLSACSPAQQVRTHTNPEIKLKIKLKEEIQKITSEEIYAKLVLNLDAYETARSISLCLGADENFMNHIFEKIHPKVESYKQKIEPSEITTESYAKYIRNTINKEIAKINL